MRYLVALLFLIPAAAGQAILTDPEGDHEAGFTPQESWGEPVMWMEAEEHGWFPYVDLLSMGIADETESTLTFEVRVRSDAPGDADPREFRGGIYTMPFTWRGGDWLAAFIYDMEDGEAFFLLGHVDDADRIGPLPRLSARTFAWAEPLEDGIGWRAVVEKTQFRDLQQVPIRAGDVLGSISARATGYSTSYYHPCIMFQATDCWRARDLVEGSTEYTVKVNPKGVGHLHARSDAPFRGSNGAATTYLFNVTVRNLDDIEDRVLIQVGGQPSDWVVRAPSTITLAPKETVTLPVAVSVPFRHVHGEQAFMDVRLTSTAVPGIEAVQTLGVVWHEVPQPGGHHPILFIHATEDGYPFMNARADEPDAMSDQARSNSWSRSSGVMGSDDTIGFTVRLSPRLLMGLDFEAGQTATLDAGLMSDADRTVDARAELVLAGEGGDRVLASLDTTMELSEGSNPFTWDLPVPANVDRIPFDGQANLVLRIFTSFSDDTPLGGLDGFNDRPIALDVSDATLRLPLQEFHDVIDQELLSKLARLSLRADGEAGKAVNPGKTAAFAFIVGNAGTRTEDVRWSLEGENVEWARVVPAASAVRPGTNATVLVAVTPPADAQDGDRADLLLIGQSTRDPDVQIFGRVAAIVTTSQDIADESDRAGELENVASRSAAKQSPGAPFLLVLAAIAVGLLRRKS